MMTISPLETRITLPRFYLFVGRWQVAVAEYGEAYPIRGEGCGCVAAVPIATVASCRWT